MNTVWIVLNSQQVADRLRELIDNGQLAQANEYVYLLQAFVDKMKSFCQAKGGTVTLALYERIIMQLAVTDAEELPDILDDYQTRFKHRLACGIGMTFAEASKAAQKSVYSGEIEMYEPSVHEHVDFTTFTNEKVDSTTYKTETPRGMVRDELSVPPNLFDPLTPTPQKADPVKNPVSKFVNRPSAEQEAQGEANQINTIIQQIGGQSPEQAQAAQQQQQPQDLLEALNGGPVQGHNVAQQQPQAPQGAQEEPDEKEVEGEVDDAADNAEKFNQQLADQLHGIKSQLPQIMALADSNPKAFHQAMNVISKLITVAKQNNKVKKAQVDECEELEKAIENRMKAHLPVGTQLGRKRKVLIDGKSVWRSMASGQVQDAHGPISVRSSNLNAEGKNKPTEPDQGNK